MQITGNLVILLKYVLCLCVIFLRNSYLRVFFLGHSLPSFLTTRSLSIFLESIVLLSGVLHNLYTGFAEMVRYKPCGSVRTLVSQ